MDELKQKLLDACNESGLPLDAIMYVTKDLWRDVEETYRRVMREAEAKKVAEDALKEEEES